MLDQHVNHLNHGTLHPRRDEALVRAQGNLANRLLQALRLGDVDGDELEDAVLRDDVDDHGALGLVVDVDERDAPGARLEHAAAGFVEGTQGVDGDGFEGVDVYGAFDV